LNLNGIYIYHNYHIMFNGLSVKSSDGGKPSSNSSSATNVGIGIASTDGSGFSFLCTNPPINEDRSIPSPINQQGEDDLVASDRLLSSPSGVTCSGFSFLSTSMVPQQPKQEVMLDSSMTNPNASTDTDNRTSNSGFSFLSNKTTAAATTTTHVATEERTIFEPPTSAFSFLNSAVGISTTQQQQQQQHPIPKEYNIEKEERTTNPPSAFSFLGQGSLHSTNSLNSDVATNSLPNMAPFQPKLPSYTVIPNNPIFSNNSATATAAETKHIPTPSTVGVVFEGASKPAGAIQKKRRGKKIGVGAQDQQEPISTQLESNTATISTTNNQYQHPSITPQEEGAENIRTAAAIAAERAEQFILQKQKEIIGREGHTTASSSSDSFSVLHTGRYGTSKESKNEVVPPDATVEAAERAAKEAQHLMVNGNGNTATTKNGIMSGFFGRTSKKFGFHLGNTSIHGKGTVGTTQHDGNHSGSNTPPRQNLSDSSVNNDSNKHIPSESIQESPDLPASSHFATPSRNGSLSFIIPAPTLSIASGITNLTHDGIKRDDNMDQATMQRRLEEERRAQFKEQERLWQAAQKEREEAERLAREREEERLRKIAEEERRKNRSPQEKINELLVEFSSETQQAMKLVVEVRF
jgi:hypothetical protein